VRVCRPGILSLDVKDPTSVAHVVVVPKKWASVRLAHEKSDYSPTVDCAKIAFVGTSPW
jgi:hypothetical protein